MYQVFFSKVDIRSTHIYCCLIAAGVQEEWEKRIHNLISKHNFSYGGPRFVLFNKTEELLHKKNMNVLKIVKHILKTRPKILSPCILPVSEQIRLWQKAIRKMKWTIQEEEFHGIGAPPRITDKDRLDGYIDVALSYGFGDDGKGNADSILSGKTAWEYALRYRSGKTWQCEHIHFDSPEYFRMRPDAPSRPKGFYFSKIQTGQRYQNLTVSQVLTRLDKDTCFGPEGIQFLIITHPHFQYLMNEKKIPFMAMGDYDVAPHGFSDFFDSLQMFCSQDILGLGIGNVDRHYPLFGIPTLRFSHN